MFVGYVFFYSVIGAFSFQEMAFLFLSEKEGQREKEKTQERHKKEKTQ